MKKIFFLGIICCSFLTASGQKVGLVFSGGGAKGLAHIGVLKALEENNIPIDYVVGTSMGGIIGGMYAAGYSPAQIEYLALSTDFQNWVNGRFESDYKYFFKKKPENPSLITVKLQIDTGFQTKIRSNFINDIPLNFALMELLAQASANANEDFNKLFVPYRCIVADIFSQKMIPLSHGSLAEAVRGTLTVPLVYRPIKVDGKYVFDGGLYNNFPVDVMQKEFKPDYIIGTNVSEKVFNEYPKDTDEKLMNRFMLYLLLSKTDSTSIGKNGIYIQPDITGFSATSFTSVEELIKRGYDATMADIPAIKLAVGRRVSPEEVKKRREKFNNRNPDLTFNNMVITGIRPKQKKYVESVFNNKSKSISLGDIKNGYYKLVADDNFETVYPRTSYDPQKEGYNFELQVQPQKNFKAELGGVVSTRPISNAYLGLQYNYLHRNSYTFSANFYSGGFYESAQGAIRMDIPTSLPFYLETEFTYNHWNYFSNTQIFIENPNPTYVNQSDRRVALKMGIPVASNGKLEVQTGYIHFNHRYSPTNSYQLNDMLDATTYNGVFASVNLERNTFNRRQYATRGRNFQLSLNMYDGSEHYVPGNIFRNEPAYGQIKETKDVRSWYRIKLSNEQYIINKKLYSFGYLFESVLSNQPVFGTYKATLLSAPAFYPLQDSRSLFLEKFRAASYGAFGIKNIFNVYKNVDLRLEGYVFQPVEEFKLENLQSTSFEDVFAKRHYAATAGLVYNSIAGPVSLSVNHYDDKQHRFGVLFHIGFLIYNKRSFE